jgi:hypothetical protein
MYLLQSHTMIPPTGSNQLCMSFPLQQVPILIHRCRNMHLLPTFKIWFWYCFSMFLYFYIPDRSFTTSISWLTIHGQPHMIHDNMIVLSADTTKGSIRESSCLSNMMAHNLFCLVRDTLHPNVTYAGSMHMWSHLDAYLYMYVLECTYFYVS